MEIKELEKEVAKRIPALAYSTETPEEALKKATDFLVIQTFLLDFIKESSEDLARVQTIYNASFGIAMTAAKDHKNVTQQKAQALVQDDVVEAMETDADIEASITWAKGYLKIFDNAHITFRNIAKD